MSKKRSRATKPTRTRPLGKLRAIAVVGLTITVVAASLAVAYRKPLGLALSSRSAAAGEPQQTLSLSKEYIYTGGRLIATEEPPATVTVSAPTSLRATTTSATGIHLLWTAPVGAVKYEIQRSANFGSPDNGFAAIASDYTPTTFDDTVNTGLAYIYRVRAFDTSNNASPFSEIDLATAMTFMEDPLQKQLTVIKELHLTQLREAVSAARVAAGIGPFSNWTDLPPLAQTVKVKAVHVTELRSHLELARAALSLPAPSYVDTTLTQFVTTVKTEHLQQIRDLVKGYRTAIGNGP